MVVPVLPHNPNGRHIRVVPLGFEGDAFVDGIVDVFNFRVDNLIGEDVFVYNVFNF